MLGRREPSGEEIPRRAHELYLERGGEHGKDVEDWGKLLGDSTAVTAMLDRLLHHGHILKCGPRSWRTKLPAEQ